ncbi:TIR domain-containing protein [Empedobacter falsenii]|uniref:TIR domain-containing protein n=1 Tax=Empedobacter falsenii TaxID=343874 RepID=UPI003A81331E
MTRKVFYSFHFDNDNWRAGQVRNIGTVEGDKPVNGNKWEEVKSKSDAVIKAWIEDNLKDKSCLIVLIGEKTSERKWVDYEIKRAWELGKAVCGIYIHNLEDVFGEQSRKGKNPLNTHIPIFESSYVTSKYVYDDIKNNISDLVEKAIKVRSQYS